MNQIGPSDYIAGRNKRLIGIILLIGLLSFAMISCCVVFFDHNQWNAISEDWTYEVPAGLRIWVDYVKEEENSIVIEGYAFVHGEDLNIVNTQVVIFDELDSTFYAINTSVCDRGDLTAYFNEGYSYDEGRFFARVSFSRLNLEHEYSVHLLYRCNGYNTLLDTGRRITKDVLQ